MLFKIITKCVLHDESASEQDIEIRDSEENDNWVAIGFATEPESDCILLEKKNIPMFIKALETFL